MSVHSPNRQQSFYKLILPFIIFLWLLAPSTAWAQQPFTTDDAEVTPKGKLHFEFSNQYDLLQRSASPALRQNTAEFELDYGLFERVEVGVVSTVVIIYNAAGTNPRTTSGIGDTTIAIKYNFLRECEGSRRPAMAASFSVGLPTGDAARQLGTGLTNYALNGILQKSLANKTTLRINSGILFAGTSTNGVVNLRARGGVFTSGSSLTRQFTSRLNLGVEVTGAAARNSQLGAGALQTLVGGNYALRDNLTLDFGVVAGRFAASPRAGVQLGFSYDF